MDLKVGNKEDNSQSKGKPIEDEYALFHGKEHWKKDCPKLAIEEA